MSFKILYEGKGVHTALVSLAAYMDGFAKGLGLTQLNVNTAKLGSVAAALVQPPFPHKEGLEKASPFKKAANFFVWFVAERPILDELPVEVITPELKSISNHQNVIFAYHMAVDCLHGAEIHKNGTVVPLKNKIKVSGHFFHDFVDTFADATPQVHFKPVTLLFEQLAYKANPGAPYPEVI